MAKKRHHFTLSKESLGARGGIDHCKACGAKRRFLSESGKYLFEYLVQGTWQRLCPPCLPLSSETKAKLEELLKDGALNVIADWSMIGSVAKFQSQVQGFDFKGVGWYLEPGGDSLLVQESLARSMKVGGLDGEPIYRFSVWNNRDPRVDFINLVAIGMMPVRSGE